MLVAKILRIRTVYNPWSAPKTALRYMYLVCCQPVLAVADSMGPSTKSGCKQPVALALEKTICVKFTCDNSNKAFPRVALTS